MAGISSKAASSIENKKQKFQGQEFTNDFEIGMYEFRYRMHDCQTGRFWQVDPLADKYVYNSIYAFSENHVTSHVELEGLEKVSIQNLSHAGSSNHHKQKDLSVMILNRDQTLTKTTSTSFDQKNTVPKGFSDAVSWIRPDVSETNFVTTVSETVSTYNSTIVNGENGKLLKTTTTGVTTEVSFSVNDISAINVTTNTTIGYSKIMEDKPKENAISISLNSSLIGTPDISQKTIPLENTLSANLSKLSPALSVKVAEAVKVNTNSYEKTKKIITNNTIH